MKLEERLNRIELILSDVDGVMTDGGIIYDNQGIEIKRFHVRDGLGIKLWRRAGFEFGILTARTSHIVKVRAAELGLEIVRQGFEQKLPTALDVIEQRGLRPDQVAYIGDDLTDLPVMRRVGVAIAPPDAVDEVREVAALVTKQSGGRGVVREVIETILKAKHRWDDLIQSYTQQ